MFEANLGGIDKTIRVVAAAFIGGLGYYYQSLWGLVALVPLFTVGTGWCPLYAPFGISTRLDTGVDDDD